ncbi:MAG: 30S ribosomal protein THX [Sediminibacterium sp.]|nr:30S ribosomal protein THX [Sediminibacterium sp.]
MGKGDKKSAKGKRFKGSFGKSRPAKSSKITKPVVKAS